MFQGSRNHFRTAWTGLRERGTLRLFAFEFVVVVLGVLAAQIVQNWAQERAKRQDAEDTLVRLQQQMLAAKGSADVWRAAVPCLEQRVGEIMRAAASGDPVAVAITRRPKLNQQTSTGVTPEEFSRIEAMVGTKQAVALADVVTRIDLIRDATLGLRKSWDKFRLLDPSLGESSALDRATVREAGASILTDLRTIQFAVDIIEKNSPLVTARHLQPFDPATQTLPVRNCEEIWANGTAYRSLDPGEKPPY